jgi:hypothetical protein
MSYPLWDLAGDLAVAQAQPATPIDPALADATEARTLRRRIAALLWIPGGAGVLYLGGWTRSGIVGVAGFVLLLVGLWLYAERGDWIADALRRR